VSIVAMSHDNTHITDQLASS